MARRAAKINELRELDAGLLLLSAGDFSGSSGIVEMYRARFLAETMTELGYDAVAVGERDLNFGVRTLKEYAERGLPLICANLFEGGERVFPPFLITKVHGKRVGVLALLGTSPRELHGLEIRDPVAEGRDAIDRMRGRADCIILLAHMEREQLGETLPALAGVDLVIRGHTIDIEHAAGDCADTIGGFFEDAVRPILFAGDRARALGLAVIAAGNGQRAAIVERRLLALDAAVPDDPATAERVRSFLAEEGIRRRELAVSRSLSRDERTGRIVERYLGVDVCARCHGDLMPRFILSRHFRAMETLRARGQDGNPACIPCHTTGFGRPTGYSPGTEAMGAPYLQGVQCEACHGPGTLHERGGPYVASGRSSCGACHTSKWSPDFEYDAYWRRAAHCGTFADSLAAGAP